jgi:nitronate monooxygenase
MLKPSIVAAGLDPDNLPARGTIDIAKDISIESREKQPTRWRDVWSAGHSVSGVEAVVSVADLVNRTRAEYDAARATLKARL